MVAPMVSTDARGIVVRMIRVSAVLADEFGLVEPIVRVDVPTDGTFLRTIRGRNQHDEFPRSQCFIAGERHDLAPGRRQNRTIEARLRFRLIRKKSSNQCKRNGLQRPDDSAKNGSAGLPVGKKAPAIARKPIGKPPGISNTKKRPTGLDLRHLFWPWAVWSCAEF